MDRKTLSKIQNYLRVTLGSKQIKIEGRENKIDSADVTGWWRWIRTTKENQG